MSLTLDTKRSSNSAPHDRYINGDTVAIEVIVESPTVHVDRIAGVPRMLIDLYARAAVRHAIVEPVDGEAFAEIKDLSGIYGEGKTAANALQDLADSLPAWIELKLLSGARLPEIDGVSFPAPAGA